MVKAHSFHIPVMGTGFTIDSPFKVAHLGIDSVISLVDDILIENIRKMYCEKFEIPYKEITNKIDDFRAKRITSYLNLLNNLIEKKVSELKNSALDKGSEIKEYFNLLPDSSTLKQEFKKLIENNTSLTEIGKWVKENLYVGSIDVNIMTKLDKDNYNKEGKLPIEYNDAHAALRGFALSDLKSSIIFSAGMNQRLYTYIEQFDDFYPNENNEIKKKVVLKVSDYRSALIQSKILAKKGIWVSEYRIESGLNCGGHAFASDGFLLGPILEEIKKNRQFLIDSAFEILVEALKNKNKYVPKETLPIKITVQGGVGTPDEHNFLLEHYDVDSVGWGSPFLLVPEASTVDDDTLQQLSDAKEDDLYLSGISPLGVPFNSLRGNTQDVIKMKLVENGSPGSTCPKAFLKSSTEYTDKAICTASKRYQRIKIKELEEKNLSEKEYKEEYFKIIEKSCICDGLGTSALIKYNLPINDTSGVSICPGPNMAYYSKKRTLKEMIDHIYDRANVFDLSNRPNMFIKELNLYINYLKNKVNETKQEITKKQEKYFIKFENNLVDGIDYYTNLFSNVKNKFENTKSRIINDLEESKKTLNNLAIQIKELTVS